MLICDYIVESIDGDYAHLRRTDLPEEELLRHEGLPALPLRSGISEATLKCGRL